MTETIRAAKPLVAGRQSSGRAGVVLLIGFAAALFGSAFLLFSVQPVVSRLILPRLGGSPGVWNTCVCFFQAALLLGYCYAHLVATRLPPRLQVLVHGAVLVVALVLLPLSLGTTSPPVETSPVPWLLSVLASRIGLPFVAIAATAPLMQGWFARTSHKQAADPYFLYAASNAGSLLALLSYPVLIETTLDLSVQMRLWSWGFVALAAAVLVCGAGALLRQMSVSSAPKPAGLSFSAPTSEDRRRPLRWVVLSFVPSALMLAVTTHITTDVASVPLFWIVPLAIYILTFIVAFARRAPTVSRTMLAAQAVTLALAAVVAVDGLQSGASMIVPLLAFTATAVVCHTELAARRPAARHLTAYFLLISLGGALGGLFNALLAPVLFPIPLEYPLLLVAACLLRPDPVTAVNGRRAAALLDMLLPMLMVVGVLLLLSVPGTRLSPAGSVAVRAAIALLVGVCLLRFTRRRTRAAVALAACLAGPMLIDAGGSALVTRNFFGVLRVKQLTALGLTVIQQGTTVHGMQGTAPGEALTPLGYYRRAGPFGRFFAALRQPTPNVAVLGLGAGGLACYARPGEAWTFYEIDPMVETVARDTRYFHFLSGCANNPAVILGDARLELAAQPSRRYDLLIVDVFSSDSIPVHLLTREAMALYLAHLTPTGLILFHVTNRHLDLVPVVARLAAEAHAPTRHLFVPQGSGPMREPRTEALAIAAPGGSLDALAADGWDVPTPGASLWTDERSNVLGVMRWR